ncbi:MAG: dCTP deaminase [Rhodospirillaceae bacterium]
MILTDREIAIALETKQISITPQPPSGCFSPSSIDLSLGDKGRRWRKTPGMQIKPGSPGYNYNGLLHLQDNIDISGHILQPGDFILAWTKELIDIPERSRLAARVEGKSSIARLGVGIHITAPTIHSGFRGVIQLEMFNLGVLDIVLSPGMRICQLIFEQTLGTPEKGYSGIFRDQSANE